LACFGVDAVPGFQGRVSNTRRVYLQELSGLRGLAILIVVCGHLLQRVDRFYDGSAARTDFDISLLARFATPFSGCIIFFCISGYSLLTVLHGGSDARERAALSGYRARRILRLWPPYFLVLTATFLFLTLTGYAPIGTNQFNVQPHSLTVSFLASLIFSHDLLFGTFPRLFPPGWFIEVQFQFYLIAPILWVAYLQILNPKVRILVGCFILSGISAVSLYLFYHGPPATSRCLLVYLPYFWLGALLADIRQTQQTSAPVDRLFTRLPAGLSALVILIVLGEPLNDPTLQYAARLACLAVMFYAATVDGDSLRRVLLSRWLIRVGVASYSIFLVHLQLLQIMTPVIATLLRSVSLLPFSVLCAVISIPIVLAGSVVFYWLIERPFVAAIGRGRGYSDGRGQNLPA